MKGIYSAYLHFKSIHKNFLSSHPELLFNYHLFNFVKYASLSIQDLVNYSMKYLLETTFILNTINLLIFVIENVKNSKKLKLWLYFQDLISKVYVKQKKKYSKEKSKKYIVSLIEEQLMTNPISGKVLKKVKINLKDMKMMTSLHNKIIQVTKN